jgi:hypothetical protein
VANPGESASRRAIEPFEVRPTPATVSAGQLPDELMIDWTNVPAGQQSGDLPAGHQRGRGARDDERLSRRQEAESSSQEERRPREGADNGADSVACGQRLADCGFNLAALHPAYPIKRRTSAQRTQAS